MPHKAQPVPPIHSPEAIARAVYRAALDAPREVWLAGSAVKAILGDAAAPALVDRILSSQGYSGQQTEEAASPRPDNLFAPMDEDRDHGASGRFGDDARPTVSAYRPARLRAGAAVIACAAGYGILRTLLDRRDRS